MRQQLQAIFFDFDGVLIDSGSVKTEGFRRLFSAYDNGIMAKIIEYHHLNGGVSRVEKIRYAYEKIIGQPLTEDEVRVMARNYSRLVVDQVVAVDWIAGAREFVESNKGKVKLFVISGTPEEELQDILKRRDISHYFGEILGSPEKKPFHVRRLLEKYELKPENCVFVGDALTDYDTARVTGLNFIGVQGEVSFPQDAVVLRDLLPLQKTLAERFDW